MTLPALPVLHFVFDALACAAAAMVAAWQRRVLRPGDTPKLGGAYPVALLVGAVAGGYGLGSGNLAAGGVFAVAHSVLGALAGGILAVELYKWACGLRAPTGAVFALPFCAGVAVGRIGCLLAGMGDMTYGVPTTLPWGVDFGDGLARHPVQLYESVAMAVAAAGLARWLIRRPDGYRRYAFPAVVGVYAAQRFCWEFLKPYATIALGLNLFQFVCLLLLAYCLWQILFRRWHARSTDGASGGALSLPRRDALAVRALPAAGAGEGADRG